MALVFLGKSTCPICDRVLADGQVLVGTSHFIGDREDPLWRFSDAMMHRECFLSWELRADFVRRFNEEAAKHRFGNGTQHRMRDDGTVESVKVDASP